MDIVERLRKWGSLGVGQMIPEDLAPNNYWGPALTKVLNESADEIERLRVALGRASSPVHDDGYVRGLLTGGRYRDPWHPPECGGFQGNGD